MGDNETGASDLSAPDYGRTSPYEWGGESSKPLLAHGEEFVLALAA
jgi:hypothetical protein